MAQKAANAKTRSQGGAGRTILTVVLMIPVIAVLLPSCVVLLINMAPTVVAWMVDRARPRYLAITVGMLNFCGSLPAEFELWRHGQSYEAAFDIATDPFHWLTAYGAAAVGWMVYLALPAVLRAYYGMTTASRLQTVKKRQAQLVETWGEEVADVAEDSAKAKR